MEGPPGISAERARLLLRGGDGAAMWGRRVGERGKMLCERPRDRAEELTSGPGRSGTERAGEARAGRRGCGSRPSERASGRDGPARGGSRGSGPKGVEPVGPREESWALGCCERGPVAGAGRVRPGRERARGRWAAWAEWSGRVGPGAGEREREETDRAGLTWAGFGFWLVLGFSFLFLLLF